MADQEDNSTDLSKVPNADADALLKKHYGYGFVTLEDSVRVNTEGLSRWIVNTNIASPRLSNSLHIVMNEHFNC